ncbi:hypothetical protein IGI04_024508, partial [Brassica rapa subsp. trilocularis]
YIFSQTYRRDPPSPLRSAVSVEIRRLRRDPPSPSRSAISLSHNRRRKWITENRDSKPSNVDSCSRFTTQRLIVIVYSLLHLVVNTLFGFSEEYKHLVTQHILILDDMDFYSVVQLVQQGYKMKKS